MAKSVNDSHEGYHWQQAEKREHGKEGGYKRMGIKGCQRELDSRFCICLLKPVYRRVCELECEREKSGNTYQSKLLLTIAALLSKYEDSSFCVSSSFSVYGTAMLAENWKWSVVAMK